MRADSSRSYNRRSMCRSSYLKPADRSPDLIWRATPDGTAGAIFALSAAGAAPISSCNGGLLGDTSHSSQVPHILFSVTPDRLAPILAAAKAADVGLLNNSGHVEVFASGIPGLRAFARQLLHQLEQ